MVQSIMCIIAYVKKGIDMPSKEVLQTMFNNNNDGCGFAYIHKDMVQIKKGFFVFDEFYNELQKSLEKVPTSQSPYLLHFRITTQGGTRASNCHPFPSSSKLKRLKQTRATTKIAIAHNGIIPEYSKAKWGATTSDTMDFIQDFASPLIDNNTSWWQGAKGKAIKKALQEVAQSKLAILGNDGHCELIGNFVEDGGVYYSNTTYKTSRYTYTPTNWTYNPSKATWQASTSQAEPKKAYTKYTCPFVRGDYSNPYCCYNCTDYCNCCYDNTDNLPY